MSSRAAKRERRAHRARVRAVFLGALTTLREVFARRLKDERARWPETRLPCETCAFRTSTDHWRGFEQTAANFVSALDRGSTFYCHDQLELRGGDYVAAIVPSAAGVTPDPRRMPPCAAWLVFQSNPPFNVADVLDRPVIEAAHMLADSVRVCSVSDEALR